MQPVPRRGYAGKAGFTTAARKRYTDRKTAGRADADIHGTTTRTADTARTAGTTTDAPTADNTAAIRTADVSAGNAATDVRRVLPESGKRYPAAAHGISPNVSRTTRRAAMAATTVATGTVDATAAGTRHADGSGNYGKGIPFTATA